MEKPNKIERLKKDKKPYQYDIVDVDWDNLSEEDRFYLKNYGIYNIKLRPAVYMIRLRIDGGFMGRDLFLKLIEYAINGGYRLILTARAQIEIHDIMPADILRAYRDIHSMGFESSQTLTDNFRAIAADPYDGLAIDSMIECAPIIGQIRSMVVGKKGWLGTIPRKFNTALIGRKYPIINPWGNDLLFALAQRDGQYGFNIYLGGKNNQTAQKADIFIIPEDAPRLFMAVAKVFNRYGLRGSRSKNRLYFLIDKIGMESVRGLIEGEFGDKLISSGDLLVERMAYNKETLLKDGRVGIVVDTNFGELDLERIKHMVNSLAHTDEIRLGYDQNIHMVSQRGFTGAGSPLPQVTACAGSRYCPLSLWDIKKDIEILPADRLAKLGVSVGFSGCLKGCGRHHHNDIGLVGLRTNLYGETERALRVYMGNTWGDGAMPARLLYYSVPSRSFRRLIDTILDEFQNSQLHYFSDFSEKILSKYDDEFLQLWFLAKTLDKTKSNLDEFADSEDMLSYLHEIGTVDIGEDINKVVKRLSIEAWGK